MSSTRLNVADAGLAGDAASASGKARSASGGSGRLLGGVAGAAKAVGSGATTGVMAGLKGVVSVGKGVGKGAMSSGRGFRDFLLRGQVVELAVAGARAAPWRPPLCVRGRQAGGRGERAGAAAAGARAAAAGGTAVGSSRSPARHLGTHAVPKCRSCVGKQRSAKAGRG